MYRLFAIAKVHWLGRPLADSCVDFEKRDAWNLAGALGMDRGRTRALALSTASSEFRRTASWPRFRSGPGGYHLPALLTRDLSLGERLMTRSGLKLLFEGELVFNKVDLMMIAALAGHGVAFVVEDHAASALADGRLVRILEDWCEPFDGYCFYYPSRRQPSPAFTLLLEALRYCS